MSKDVTPTTRYKYLYHVQVAQREAICLSDSGSELGIQQN